MTLNTDKLERTGTAYFLGGDNGEYTAYVIAVAEPNAENVAKLLSQRQGEYGDPVEVELIECPVYAIPDTSDATLDVLAEILSDGLGWGIESSEQVAERLKDAAEDEAIARIPGMTGPGLFEGEGDDARL